MKKWAWLAVLTWVVVPDYKNHTYRIINEKDFFKEGNCCTELLSCSDSVKWECEDWVEVFNEAHERRTQKGLTMEEYLELAPCAGPNPPHGCGVP